MGKQEIKDFCVPDEDEIRNIYIGLMGGPLKTFLDEKFKGMPVKKEQEHPNLPKSLIPLGNYQLGESYVTADGRLAGTVYNPRTDEIKEITWW
jgi:hypothetical protein